MDKTSRFKLSTQPSHDQTKPWKLGQQAPLTAEYQKILEDSIADRPCASVDGGQKVRARSGSAPCLPEYYIAEGNGQIAIGNENYFLSGDGLLMSAKKNQAARDLRDFKQTGR